MTAGKTIHFSSSKINTNPPITGIPKNSISEQRRKFKENQAKITNLILKKYNEI